MGFKYKFSKTRAREYAKQMDDIQQFCIDNGIQASRSLDSFYFNVNGVEYRVSNHSVEASNAHAFNEFGEQVRDVYHKDGRKADTVYIHASKTRIPEIYNDLVSGYKLDGRGYRI